MTAFTTVPLSSVLPSKPKASGNRAATAALFDEVIAAVASDPENAVQMEIDISDTKNGVVAAMQTLRNRVEAAQTRFNQANGTTFVFGTRKQRTPKGADEPSRVVYVYLDVEATQAALEAQEAEENKEKVI